MFFFSIAMFLYIFFIGHNSWYSDCKIGMLCVREMKLNSHDVSRQSYSNRSGNKQLNFRPVLLLFYQLELCVQHSEIQINALNVSCDFNLNIRKWYGILLQSKYVHCTRIYIPNATVQQLKWRTWPVQWWRNRCSHFYPSKWDYMILYECHSYIGLTVAKVS